MQHERRRFDVLALALVGACVAGLYGAALPDITGRTMSHAPVEGTVGNRVSGMVPTAPSARLLATARARPTVASRPETDRMLKRRLNVATVNRLYDGLGYGLDTVRTETVVPRLFLASVPKGLKDVRDVDLRKSLFLRMTLPLILKVNEEIANDRARLKALIEARDQGRALRPEDRRWLEEKSAWYGLKSPDMDKLLIRMDIIPPSLALAQAAEESGWGTSRFARLGNALFGQWTTDSDNGIVPLKRDEGKDHAIKAFPDLLMAVRAYARNLNTHRAYREFRERRAALREEGKRPTGPALAPTLLRYSERGEAYVESLYIIMRANDLMAFDTAVLSPRPVELASLQIEESAQ